MTDGTGSDDPRTPAARDARRRTFAWILVALICLAAVVALGLLATLGPDFSG